MYKFGEDWFCPQIPIFNTYLSRYKNVQCDFLEIGSFEGRSAIWMLENVLTHSQSTITCIDLWEYPWDIEKYKYIYHNFVYNILIGNFIDKIEFYKAKSGFVLKLSKVLSKKYDFVYIDGAHHAPHPLEDAVLSFPLLKVGGILAFDDYLWNIDISIKKCIDSFLLCYEPHIKIIHKDYQVWIEKISELT